MKHPLRIPVALAALFAVSACTGPGSTIDASSLQPLTADEGRDNGGPMPAPEGANTAAGTLFSGGGAATSQAGQVAAINTNARVQFAPAVGVSAEAVPALSERLRARATQRGVGVASSGGAPATHVMKGYFSAFTEGTETTVIYVWDVLDPSGNRLHRIQGQQKQPGSDAEGWQSVSAATMETIADRTIDDLALWLSSSTG